jgi:catechol-2,3-dioxygenase
MAGLKDKCVCIKLYFKPEGNALEIFQMLKISFWNAENKNNVIF